MNVGPTIFAAAVAHCGFPSSASRTTRDAYSTGSKSWRCGYSPRVSTKAWPCESAELLVHNFSQSYLLGIMFGRSARRPALTTSGEMVVPYGVRDDTGWQSITFLYCSVERFLVFHMCDTVRCGTCRPRYICVQITSLHEDQGLRYPTVGKHSSRLPLSSILHCTVFFIVHITNQ